ncbi:MAG: hypothetical protein ACREMH_07860 [Gemmatimonadales bacterium]
MDERPYPALVKPDAVVLLPPEELEEQPRGVWPEQPRRRSRWRPAATVGIILAIGVGIGAMMAKGPEPGPAEPQMLDGISGAQSPTPPPEVGAMEAAAIPEASPPRSAERTESRVATPPPRPVASFDDVLGSGSTELDPAPARTVASFDDARGAGTTRLDPTPARDTVPEPATELAQAPPERDVPEPIPSQPSLDEIRRQQRAAASEVARLTQPPANQPPPRGTPAASGTSTDREPEPVARTVIAPLEVGSPPQPSLVPDRAAPTRTASVEQARTTLTQGAMRFAGALGQVRTSGTGALTRQMTSIDARGSDLLRFAERVRPSVGTTRIGSVTVNEGTAYADATLTLEWRGDFGVTRRGDIRVRLAAREQDGEWLLAGAQPLDGGPR